MYELVSWQVTSQRLHKKINMAQRCLIVGAGLSGLVAANILKQVGLAVVVLDKAHGVGGRMATRRVENDVFDHGAQYFTARDSRFVKQVSSWQAAGIARTWARGFFASDGTFKFNNEERYIGAMGMTSIPKYLAQSVDIRLEQRVDGITVSNRVWQVETETGDLFSSDALLLTPPLPQSLALLDTGEIALPAKARADLERISYHACLAVMATLAGPSRIAAPGGVWLEGEPLRSIADNHQKGISPEGYGITIHAGPEFSQQHWDMDPESITQLMFDAAATWIGTDITAISLPRWRYSQPASVYSEPCFYVSDPAPLALAGDAFGAPRLEGAALSGLTAAERLIKVLQ